MQFFINTEHKDLLVVEGNRCALNFLVRDIAHIAYQGGLDEVDSCGDTLDDIRDENETGNKTYRELIADGFYTEVSIDEL
jgi:hypothetical protein